MPDPSESLDNFGRVWPMCEWDLAREIGPISQDYKARPCRNAFSLTVGSRRPFYMVCEVCKAKSKRLRRFYKTSRRTQGMRYNVIEFGQLVDVIRLERPEEQIARETREAGVYYYSEENGQINGISVDSPIGSNTSSN
jgi:hypothetical protein